MNPDMPKAASKEARSSKPSLFKPHSFNLPVGLLADVERIARREAKGRRPNMSTIARRALQAEVARCKTKTTRL
jgi:hypothetical protein